VQDVIVYAGLLAAAIGPVLVMLGSIASAIPPLISAFALLGAAKTAVAASATGLWMALGNVVTALQTNMVGALTTGETMLLRVGQAAALAAAAFVGWKIGEWAYEHIPALRALGDAVADVIDKFTGLGDAIAKWSGATEKVQRANSDLEFSVQKLEESLKRKGVQVERGNLSLEEYAKKLQEVAKGLSGATDEAKKTTDAHIKLGKSAKDAAKEQREWEKALDKWRDTTSKARTEAWQKDTTTRALLLTIKDVGDRYKQLTDQLVEYKARLMEGRDATYEMEMAAIRWDAAIGLAESSLGNLSDQIKNLPLPAFQTQITDSKSKINELEGAFKALGITSANTFTEKRKAAEDAYKAIKDSGIATAEELKQAELAYLDAVKREQEVLTGKVNDETQKRIDALKKEGPTFADEFGKSLDGVSTAVSNATQKMVGMLIGLESGSVLDALKELGRGVISHLVEPWVDALGDLIERGVKKLISWLIEETGLMGAVKTVGAALGGLFGFGGGTAGGAAAGGAAAGGAAAGGASAGGAAAGGAAVVGALGASLIGGAVAGGLSMIGSIVGAKMLSGDMGKVEENTRYTAVALIGAQGVIDLLWNLSDHAYKIREKLLNIEIDGIGKIHDLMNILIIENAEKIRDYCKDIKNNTLDLVKQMTQPAQITVNIEGNVIGNQEFIDQLTEAIGKKLRLSAAT